MASVRTTTVKQTKTRAADICTWIIMFQGSIQFLEFMHSYTLLTKTPHVHISAHSLFLHPIPASTPSSFLPVVFFASIPMFVCASHQRIPPFVSALQFTCLWIYAPLSSSHFYRRPSAYPCSTLLQTYSLGLMSTATFYGQLGTGGSGGMGTYVLPPTRYTVTTRMTLH